MCRVILVTVMLALIARTSVAQGATPNASRTLDAGSIVRVTTDSGELVGQLAAPLKTDRAARVILFPCSTCAPTQYLPRSIRSLDVQTGSSRGTHIGLGALIGVAVGAATGALLSKPTEWGGQGLGASVYGVMGLVVGTGVGVVLPVHHGWLRVWPAQ